MRYFGLYHRPSPGCLIQIYELCFRHIILKVNFLIVSLASNLLYLLYNLPSYQHCNFCTACLENLRFRRYKLLLYINQIIYIYIYTSICSGAAPGFREGEHRTKFHTWFPLKSCTAMASPKFRFGGHSAKMYSSKTLKNLYKICTKI